MHKLIKIMLDQYQESDQKLHDQETPEGLIWGVRTVHPDLRSSRGYRWRWGWNEASGPFEGHKGPCPLTAGDGICVAKNWEGMASGGIPASTLLLTGYLPDDVLGEDHNKVRVRRAFVVDIVDGVPLISKYGERADLRGADLWGADLRNANLRGADLRNANLRGANLRNANLRNADLRGAGLGNANLRNANLRNADLWGAGLGNADLGNADLRNADLRNANLGNADLRNADLGNASLWNADLRGVDLSPDQLKVCIR